LKPALQSICVLKPDLALTDTQWLQLERLEEALVPFKCLTDLLGSSGYPTLSIVYPSLKFIVSRLGLLLEKYKEEGPLKYPEVMTVIKTLRQNVVDRFGLARETVPGAALLASILNPSFRTMSHLSIDSPLRAQTMDLLREQYQKEVAKMPSTHSPATDVTPPSTKKMRFADKHSDHFIQQLFRQEGPKEIDEIKIYFALPPIQPKVSPLRWWIENKGALPVLWRLARRYLAIPGTSIPVERLWSHAGNFVTNKRSSLDPETVSDAVFCYENFAFVPKPGCFPK